VFRRFVEKTKPLLVDRTARWLLLAAGALNLAAWAVVLARLFSLIAKGSTIALHYNVYLQVNQVGPAAWALLPAAIGFVCFWLNLELALRAYPKSRPLALVVLLVTGFYELIALAAGVFIIFINIAR
jgi:hypothetical protein